MSTAEADEAKRKEIAEAAKMREFSKSCDDVKSLGKNLAKVVDYESDNYRLGEFWNSYVTSLVEKRIDSFLKLHEYLVANKHIEKNQVIYNDLDNAVYYKTLREKKDTKVIVVTSQNNMYVYTLEQRQSPMWDKEEKDIVTDDNGEIVYETENAFYVYRPIRQYDSHYLKSWSKPRSPTALFKALKKEKYGDGGLYFDLRDDECIIATKWRQSQEANLGYNVLNCLDDLDYALEVVENGPENY